VGSNESIDMCLMGVMYECMSDILLAPSGKGVELLVRDSGTRALVGASREE
jgi:hypothetical protein